MTLKDTSTKNWWWGRDPNSI